MLTEPRHYYKPFEYQEAFDFYLNQQRAHWLADEVPLAFVAVTVNVYAVPLLSPVTVIGDDAEVPVMELGDDVAVNVVTALPPVAPAVNVTVA